MIAYFDHVRRFNKNAWYFIVARVVFAFGTAVTRVFFNLFLLASGFDAALIGVAASIVQVGGAIFTVPALLLLDRIGRKRAALLGAAISMLSWAASISSSVPVLVLALQLLSGLGDVLFGMAVVPLLAELSERDERSALFSTHDGLTFLSLFFGSLIAGPLSLLVASQLVLQPESVDAYRAVLLASIGLRLIGLLPLALVSPTDAIHSTMPTSGTAAAISTTKPRALRYLDPRYLLSLTTPIWRFLVPWTVLYFAGALVSPFYNTLLKLRFGADDTTIGIVFSLFSLSEGVIVLLGPIIGIALSRRTLVSACLTGSILVLSILLLSTSLTLVAALLIARIGLLSMIVPIYKAHVIDQAPRHEFVIVSFLMGLAANIGQFSGPLVSGLTQRVFGGMNEVLIISIFATLLAAVLFGFVLQPTKAPTVGQPSYPPT